VGPGESRWRGPVAAAAAAAAGGQEPLARFGEIEKKDAGGLVVNHCPHRDRHVDRTALSAGAIAAFTVPAALGAMLGVVTELKQGVLVNGGDQVTSPPRPPSPPEGPPRGTYFSRRKAMQPLPPSPALTRMRAWSRNNMS